MKNSVKHGDRMTWEEISKNLFEKRTAKRFTFHHDVDGIDYIEDESNGVCLICDELMCSLLNELHEKNEGLKQDNTGLMKLLENQSIIIQELHSKILEFELKEPIVLTKEDLELMDKAVSYYTHGRFGE